MSACHYSSNPGIWQQKQLTLKIERELLAGADGIRLSSFPPSLSLKMNTFIFLIRTTTATSSNNIHAGIPSGVPVNGIYLALVFQPERATRKTITHHRRILRIWRGKRVGRSSRLDETKRPFVALLGYQRQVGLTHFDRYLFCAPALCSACSEY
jgi:hypothetical protein